MWPLFYCLIGCFAIGWLQEEMRQQRRRSERYNVAAAGKKKPATPAGRKIIS